jgi:uncharacterized protein with HEPN domain
LKNDRLYLHDMLERCYRLTRFIGPGRAETRGRLTSLDWKAICGMRDVLRDYIGVDLDEVWNVAYSRIPELQAVLEQFLRDAIPGSTPVS